MKNKKQKTQRLKNVRAPKGFRFRISETKHRYDFDYKKGPSYVEIKLYDNSSPLYDSSSLDGYIGLLTLERYSETTFETHSNLEDDYHGQGLGTLMYARAIQWCLANGYKVKSSSSTSELAQRVWNGKTIRKIYRLRKVKLNWGSTVWHAYRKVIK